MIFVKNHTKNFVKILRFSQSVHYHLHLCRRKRPASVCVADRAEFLFETRKLPDPLTQFPPCSILRDARTVDDCQFRASVLFYPETFFHAAKLLLSLLINKENTAHYRL